MPTCPTCQAEVPAKSRFCGECGAVVEGAVPGVPSGGSPSPTGAATVVHAPPAGFGSDALFTPGSMIAGRYRIVACLGKGGMGEVYRADDLTLGQPVALKFLPREVAENPRWLERFRNEVRVARQVAHPGVCRVHDLGEVPAPDAPGAAPLHFLTMEYIDGEDLGSLLRRIGRLPRDKAVQVARQLCAGLAAAHTAGVLHRDLKPANVMIDGRGNAKITDFGIAGLAGQIQGSDVRSGTPAYMSPEQLVGREVTLRSDLYALGLVLYELFTGRRAFQGETATSATASRAVGELSRPSSLVEDMDPTVERVILRCLAVDPAQRPSSALAVAAALPGGDPLRAALEAGETPSPELVASAGSDGRLRIGVALGLVGIAVLALAGALVVSRWTALESYVPMPRSPEVLADRAREVALRLGAVEEPADSAGGIELDLRPVNHIRRNDDSPGRWGALRTGRRSALRFWYRTSPQELAPLNIMRAAAPADPPMAVPGMLLVELDAQGWLLRYEAVTPLKGPDPEPPPTHIALGTDERADVKMFKSPKPGPAPAPETETMDWTEAFVLAGLSMVDFTPAKPTKVPPHFAGERFAWEGATRDDPGVQLRVEAASFEGRPTWFRVQAPWDVAVGEAGRTGVGRFLGYVLQSAAIGVIFLCGWLARRNYLTGRGDRSGAMRLACGFFVLSLIQWALSTHAVANLTAQWTGLLRASARSLLLAGIAWVSYIAMEPFVRRRSPEQLVSWTRLLAGRVRDPLVGRDALVGVAAGAVVGFLFRAMPLVHEAVTGRLPQPQAFDADVASGVQGTLATLTNVIVQASINAMLVFFLFITLCTALPRRRVGMVVFGVLVAIVMMNDSGDVSSPAALVFALLLGAGAAVFLRVIGLFGFTVCIMVATLLNFTPLTTELGAWYARGTLTVLAVLAGVMFWAWSSARGVGAMGQGAGAR